jgi:acyl transferase domain-containing protein
MNPQNAIEGIAVVGVAGRFPAATSIDEFWENLVVGRDCSTEHTIEELVARGLPRKIAAAPNYVRRCPVVALPRDEELARFGLRPSEVKSLDAQMLLLSCGDALKSANCDPEQFDGKVGLWAGCGFAEYPLKRALFGLAADEIPSALAAVNAFAPDLPMATVSRTLRLGGPVMRVQSACSTSLVAIHMACNALFDYQCDLALAGGVSLQYTHVPGYQYFEGEIFSPDGYCRAFDHRANGTIFGEGCGVVALRRLDEALAAGDFILAVVRGSAVNNDADLRSGYTAPGVNGQRELVLAALSSAGVSAGDIGYVEAHGTGTPLGDPIEVAALSEAFRAHTSECGFCGLGSVKTNVGHLDAAAGVTGFIKTVWSLKHRRLVPTVHFQTPNPELKLDSTPFFVVDKLMEWQPRHGRRLGGVSSFGLGGTNCHVIVEDFES